MTDPSTVDLGAILDSIADELPGALGMISAALAEPTPSLDTFAALLEEAEQAGPFLILALVRAASGLAFIANMTPGQVLALAVPDMPAGAPAGL